MKPGGCWATRVTHGVLLLAAVAALGACATSPVAIESARVERKAAGAYRIAWTAEPANAPVDVLVAQAPDASGRTARVISRADRDGVHELVLDSATRPYFQLRTRNGETRTVAERMLPLEGGRNFRDLGGYVGADGRHVRWGQLYRSGMMAGLTDGDYGYLAALGIRTICDFRSNDERRREPVHWRLSEPPNVLLRDYEMDSAGFAALMSGQLSHAEITAGMARVYAQTPYAYAADYRAMFAELLAARVPLAFNCSAGKDRTGVAAALILLALGVPRETVIEDYLLSNTAANMQGVITAVTEEQDPARAAFARMPAEVRRLLSGVEREWLEGALRGIEAQDGSVEAYLERRLGVGSGEIAALRARYLE